MDGLCHRWSKDGQKPLCSGLKSTCSQVQGNAAYALQSGTKVVSTSLQWKGFKRKAFLKNLKKY